MYVLSLILSEIWGACIASDLRSGGARIYTEVSGCYFSLTCQLPNACKLTPVEKVADL